MTTTTAAAGELSRLYGRYKALALASAAALVLDQEVGELLEEVEELERDCAATAPAPAPAPAPASAPSTAAASAPEHVYDSYIGQGLEACATAAAELGDLVRRAAAGESTSGQLERVRATHRALRREAWDVLGCEYVPCCAHPGAAHSIGAR